MIHTTNNQKAEIRKVIESNKFYRNEKVWNFLIADILSNSMNRNYYIKLFCNNSIKIESKIDIWYEAEPISPRKGKRGNSEGNTKLDLAFGNIKRRGKTDAGIEYNSKEKSSWLCFVEAKLFSDCSTLVSYDPLRNQIIRVIENLLCFQGGREFPQNLFFTLLTPRLFRDNPKSRFYGYKIDEYEDPKNIIKDIGLSPIPERRQRNWCYPDHLKDRTKLLKITWITYEEIFEKEYDIIKLDLTNLKKEPNKLEKINHRLKELASSI